MDLDEDVDAGTLAQAWGISARRVWQLVENGVVTRSESGKKGRFRFKEANCAYIEHLRSQLPTSNSNEELTSDRARLARAQAERIEIQIQEKRRELAPMALIVESIAKCAAAACDVLDGIPLAIKRRAPGADPRVLKVIEEEVYKARTIAASAKVPEPSE